MSTGHGRHFSFLCRRKTRHSRNECDFDTAPGIGSRLAKLQVAFVSLSFDLAMVGCCCPGVGIGGGTEFSESQDDKGTWTACPRNQKVSKRDALGGCRCGVECVVGSSMLQLPSHFVDRVWSCHHRVFSSVSGRERGFLIFVPTFFSKKGGSFSIG